MNCPKCTAEMEELVHESARVDRCTGCHGLWFDLNEEQHLKAAAGSERLDIGDPEVGKRYDAVRDITCPRCSTPMVKMISNGKNVIRYESCKVCHGLFFDAGEFRAFKVEGVLDLVRSWFARSR